MSDQQGYTRIPNALIDELPNMPDAERRVVLLVVRKTSGWKKRCDLISLSQFEQFTGLSRPWLIKVIQEAIGHGWIERVKVRNSFAYQLPDGLWSQLQFNPDELVNSVNHFGQVTELTGELSKPFSVNSVNHLLVNSVNTQKETIKEKKDKSAGAKSAERKPREKKEKDPTPEPIVIALADVCKIDRTRASFENRQQLYQSAGILYRAGRKAGQSDEQIAEAIKYVAGWFGRHDWRGQKGQAPTAKQIRDVWRQAIDARKPVANPIYETIRASDKPKKQIADAETRQRILGKRYDTPS